MHILSLIQLQKTPMAVQMYDLNHYITSEMKTQKPLYWSQLMFVFAQKHNSMLTR